MRFSSRYRFTRTDSLQTKIACGGFGIPTIRRMNTKRSETAFGRSPGRLYFAVMAYRHTVSNYNPCFTHWKVCLWTAGLIFVLTGLGCQDASQAVDPFNVLGLAKPPIRVGVTSLELSTFMLPKRHLFRLSLAQYLRKPVQFELMTPRQIRVHLGTGRLQFAMLKPQEYAEIAKAGTGTILAVPVNTKGQTYRQGLVVVSAKSGIQSVQDIKSQRFHFASRGNPINDGARGVLFEAGIGQQDIDHGFFGLGLDTFHINSFEVAKSVVMEANSAGVIDEADYQSWPDEGGNFLLLNPSKDQLRIIAKTVRIPEGPFIVSVKTNPKLVAKIKRFLLEIAPQQETMALAPMGYQGFAEPVEEKAYEPFTRIHQLLYPVQPETQPTNDNDVESSKAERVSLNAPA